MVAGSRGASAFRVRGPVNTKVTAICLSTAAFFSLGLASAALHKDEVVAELRGDGSLDKYTHTYT